MPVTIFSQTLDTNADGQNGYTNAEYFAVAALTLPPGGVKRIRVTFEAGSTEAYTITNAYVGHGAGSGDAYDFAATPVQLLFAGAANKAITAGTSATSDWTNFEYDKVSPLIIAFYGAGGAGSDMFRYKNSVTNVTHYYKNANDAATVNKTGYSTSALVAAINKIEVETDAGFFLFF